MEKSKGRKLRMEELGRKTVEQFGDSAKLPVTLVLDNIRSLHNVGSVFRTADAFCVEGIVLCGITARPPHRDIQKTALGATESVHWEYAASTADAVLRLREKGYRILGVEQVSGSTKLQKLDLPMGMKTALVFGNEVSGVDQSVLDLCDGFVEIPQTGTKHSLNVSVSVGIVLWELFRTEGA